MFETTISVPVENETVLDKIAGQINFSLQDSGAITARECMGSRAYFSIAAEDKSREYLEDCLTFLIAECLITDFKAEYIKKHARFCMGNEVCYSAFIGALVAFDRETDREIVLNSLQLSTRNPLDGIYNFLLPEIRERWSEVVELASENSVYLLHDDTFVELMRFLVGTVEPKLEEVEVEIEDKGFKIRCAEDGFDFFAPELKDFLPALIDLSPKKILLSGAERLPRNIKSLFSEIYKERTSYI